MINSMYQKDCSLLVCSCDNYSSAWYPYFELIKIYWPECPEKIYLNTEIKKYICEGLNIITVNCEEKVSWSERLYHCLEKIDTKYIIFTLEDYFLVDYVKNEKIQQAYSYMEENPDIAVCRLYASNDENLKKIEKYDDFYCAEADVNLRLDAQAALWNRETLMSFLDFTESPWDFENKGTERIKDTNKVFLFYYHEDCYKTENMIFPYYVRQNFGYGIAWGSYWLWKNKELFEKNNINNVDFKSLGVLSERAVRLRYKYLYNSNPKGIGVIIKPIYRMKDRLDRGIRIIKFSGIKDGLKKLLSILRKRMVGGGG